jgi:futalosine hydrolase
MRPAALRILVTTAVDAERRVIPSGGEVLVIAGGIGRANAAAATTEMLIREGPFAAVICAGIAGALPLRDVAGAGCTDPPPTEASLEVTQLEPGTIVLASECVYVEEGLITPEGFQDMRGLGFPLGDFAGNRVPVDAGLLAHCEARLGAPGAPRCRVGPVATVATCSGRDEAAREVARRTGALAESMEGAAVVHAARRLGVPAIELRSISNTTGDRSRQRWEIAIALEALGAAMGLVLETIPDAVRREPGSQGTATEGAR